MMRQRENDYAYRLFMQIMSKVQSIYVMNFYRNIHQLTPQSIILVLLLAPI